MRLVPAGAGGLALVVAIAGCASLPVDGPVRDGASAGIDMRRDVVVDPVGPLPGASPRAHVRGFLSAAVGVEDNFDAARSYLTDDAAPTWRPSENLYVVRLVGRDITLSQGGAQLPADSGGGDGGAGADPAGGPVVARVSAGVVAVLDEHGVYTAQPPGEVVTEELTLVREAGQWRIGETPDQIFVVESDFALGWEPRSLWFPDPAGTVLVPEVRWFADRESLPTAVVTELLRGPSPWLLPAVRRSGATAPQLSSAAVVVERGTAEVDLDKGVLDADAATRGLLVASIETTLRQLPRVVGVIVTAGGGRLTGATPGAPPTADVPVDADPLLLRGGEPVRWNARSELVPAAQSSRTDLAEPALALGPDPAVAALADGGTALVRWPGDEPSREGQEVARVASPSRLTAPSFDPFGWLWSTATLSDGSVRALSPQDGEGVSVAAPWLEGRTLVALAPSREGARAVVASVGDPALGVRVDVVGLRRDASGAPVELVSGDGAPSVVLGSAVDAVWIGPSTAAVLGTALAREGGPPPVRQVLTLSGGSLEPRGAPGVPVAPGGPEAPTLVSLAGGDGERTLLLGTSDRRIFQRAGARWVEVSALEGTVDPAYAG